jgi:hypothetical protein
MVGGLGLARSRETRLLWLAKRIAILGAALCSIGCEPERHPEYVTRILPSDDANALVNGRFDAARIERLVVYVGQIGPGYVEELKECDRVVTVTGEQAASEFVASLAPDADDALAEDSGAQRALPRGVIEVVLKNGVSLYFEYVLSRERQDIKAPSADGQWEGAGHGRRAWRVWLMRYVYGPETQARG